MIRSLRKRHYYMWVSLAFILPILFGIGYLSTPTPSLPNKVEHTIKGQKLHQLTLEWGEVQVYALQDSTKIVHIDVQKALRESATVIYIHDQAFDQPEEGRVLTQVGPLGRYKVPLNEDWKDKAIHLLFYDPVKKKILGTLK